MPVLPWPLAAIDFEASSLEWDGYLIEVGIVVWRAPEAPMLGWSTLIQPPLAWREGGHWSRASERVHGIGRHMLNEGLSPARVARMVNAMLGPVEVAWCDGQSVDAQWSKALFDAAGCRAAFILRDSGVLLHDLGLQGGRVLPQVRTLPAGTGHEQMRTSFSRTLQWRRGSSRA